MTDSIRLVQLTAADRAEVDRLLDRKDGGGWSAAAFDVVYFAGKIAGIELAAQVCDAVEPNSDSALMTADRCTEAIRALLK